MRIPPHAGYGFVEFDTREQAQTAINAVNDARVGGRRIAVDFAYDIRLYKAANKNAQKQPSSAPPSSKKDEMKSEDEEDKSEGEEMAITTPLTKKRPSLSPDDSQNQQTKRAKTTDEESRKLFLVNVPYESDKAAIKSGICDFAKIDESTIQTILMVNEPETGKFTGKAFVIFHEAAIAEKVLTLEKSSLPQMFGDMYKNKDGKMSTAPIEGVGCVVNGRRIAILKSLSKEQVEKEKQKKEDENKPKSAKVVNRQHIDLINSGWINETHESWSLLSPLEQRIRAASNEERKFKVGNPNFIINTKRLTVKNIPKTFENGDLQKAVISAMGLTGTKKAKRAGLKKVAIVKDKVEVADPNSLIQSASAAPEWTMDMDSEDESNTVSTPGVKTVIKKKSRGFAFIDFTTAEAALKCLQAMNNVPGAFGSGIAKRPIVEFSFDDIRKLQIQQNRAQSKARKVENGIPAIQKSAIKRLGRGQKQRLKRRLAKEKKAM